jgi:hypothetical protein
VVKIWQCWPYHHDDDDDDMCVFKVSFLRAVLLLQAALHFLM